MKRQILSLGENVDRFFFFFLFFCFFLSFIICIILLIFDY